MKIAGVRRGGAVGSTSKSRSTASDLALHDEAILVLAALTGIIA